VLRGELAVWIPADARQAAQIIAVLFPSTELLGFPGQDCKVSQKRVQGPLHRILKCMKAAELDLPRWWLNEQASSYVAPGGDSAASRVFDHPGLCVLAIIRAVKPAAT